MTKKAIGIIGGMGPDASVQLYGQMIAMARTTFGVSENHEYPEIIIDSVPVPEFFSDLSQKKRALSMMRGRVRLLNDMGVGCLALVCNTAHALLPELQAESKAPFVSMTDETISVVVERGFRTVGLLASPTTLSIKLYEAPLLKRNIRVCTPAVERHDDLSEIIGGVIAGKRSDYGKRLALLADEMRGRGAEAIILGCTELPLVFPSSYFLPVISCTDVLATSLLERYYNQ